MRKEQIFGIKLKTHFIKGHTTTHTTSKKIEKMKDSQKMVYYIQNINVLVTRSCNIFHKSLRHKGLKTWAYRNLIWAYNRNETF